MHLFREQVQDTTDSRRCAGSVNGTKHQVPCFGGVDGRHKRLLITHFANQDDVGVLPYSVLHGDLKVLDVLADLALVDQAFVIGEHELDRILERENMFTVDRIDIVQDRTNGGTLT